MVRFLCALIYYLALMVPAGRYAEPRSPGHEESFASTTVIIIETPVLDHTWIDGMSDIFGGGHIGDLRSSLGEIPLNAARSDKRGTE